MRPLRFLLLLIFFVILPIILTFISLFSSESAIPQTRNVGYHTQSSRLRALFSFSTPSALFPPSAIISLTDDNYTSFLARPAAFGPSLPSHGLNGQLWVGKGFGEDTVLSEEELKISGFELGCSDVPGWDDDHKNRPENGAIDGKINKNVGDDSTKRAEAQYKPSPAKRDGFSNGEDLDTPPKDDGTDDYLHHPLPDSNPASQEKPGEPASVNVANKHQPPTHADIESLQESADIAGKIVMLSRGGCGFLEKVKWAQRRGGIAVIVGDNEPGGQLTIMYARGDTSNVTIPAIFTSYYSAHLLSTLVPAEEKLQVDSDDRSGPVKEGSLKAKSQNVSGGRLKSTKEKQDATDTSTPEKGWVQNVLSAVGLDEDAKLNGDDSRRPPGSGNIDWVLLEDWDEEKPATTSTSTNTHKVVKTVSTSIRGVKPQSTSTKKANNDDFIIGVQDWRDAEVIAPKPTEILESKKQKGKIDNQALQPSTLTSNVRPQVTALKGGSITPGSGEYGHQKDEPNSKSRHGSRTKSGVSSNDSEGHDHKSFGEKFASFFHKAPDKEIYHPRPDEHSSVRRPKSNKDSFSGVADHDRQKHEGLWVTLTPASPSTSPFFDTLLVLVVSPLVTLTFVYGLLLLRSRIRRRRWRAPKSIVERLPVRTYHTMSSTSSTTSSSLTSPQTSTNTSPNLRPVSLSRARPRSQTTTGVLSSSSSAEKPTRASPRTTRYSGRQVECVVCLEEYVDGESQVMSLPCGHEFHADCITPWLVTRRRTCPICKGDVVRSFARNNGDASTSTEDASEESGQTSDDVQEQAVMTENTNASAAIPIPLSDDGSMNNDVERGVDASTPLLHSTPRAQQTRWYGIIGNSFGRLSGETVWRNSVNDRSDRNR